MNDFYHPIPRSQPRNSVVVDACPICGSRNIDIPIGLAGPAECLECGATQDDGGNWLDAWDRRRRDEGES